MDVRVVVKDRFGLLLNCNGRLAKDKQLYKEKRYLKTQTVIHGGSDVKIRESNGYEHTIDVVFIRRDYGETEYQCIHKTPDANPPLLF